MFFSKKHSMEFDGVPWNSIEGFLSYEDIFGIFSQSFNPQLSFFTDLAATKEEPGFSSNHILHLRRKIFLRFRI